MAASHQHSLILNPGDADESQIDLLVLKKAEIIIKALNHKLRLQIIRLLQEHKELTVSVLVNFLNMEQSVVSQHLAVLRRAGIVVSRREGKYIFYVIVANRIQSIFNIAKHLL